MQILVDYVYIIFVAPCVGRTKPTGNNGRSGIFSYVDQFHTCPVVSQFTLWFHHIALYIVYITSLIFMYAMGNLLLTPKNGGTIIVLSFTLEKL